MSVATAFRFAEAFPFCVTDISGVVPSYFEYIDDLTLAQVMEFAWNLENVELTTNGDIDYGGGVTIDGNSVTQINPMTSDRFAVGSQGGNMFFGDPLTAISLSSWPAIRQPNERVCQPSSVSINGALLDFYAVSSPDPNLAGCDFVLAVGTDPVNSGKYRLYYFISLKFTDEPSESTDLVFETRPPLGTGVAWDSGTITIAGFTIDWYSSYSPGGTPSGTGALTATSLSFTY